MSDKFRVREVKYLATRGVIEWIMQGLKDVECRVQTAAEYAQKTGCGREECKEKGVGISHSDDANGESDLSVSEILMS